MSKRESHGTEEIFRRKFFLIVKLGVKLEIYDF